MNQFSGLSPQHWQLEARKDGILILSLERKDASVNTLCQAVLNELDGLLERMAFAPPMRPPFFKLSSVSSAANTRVRGITDCARATTSSAEAPVLASSAQARTVRPRPIEALRLSTMRTSIPGATARAAISALCMVADSASRSQTFGSVLFQLGDTPQGQIRLGLPHRDAWQTLAFTA